MNITWPSAFDNSSRKSLYATRTLNKNKSLEEITEMTSFHMKCKELAARSHADKCCEWMP